MARQAWRRARDALARDLRAFGLATGVRRPRPGLRAYRIEEEAVGDGCTCASMGMVRAWLSWMSPTSCI